MKYRIAPLALSLGLISCGGGGETDSGPDAPEVCDAPYQNTVEAAPWAQALSPVRTYLYEADVAGGFADVHLLDANDVESHTMRVRQVFDQTGTVRGAMQASMGALTLTTTGSWGGEPRYTVTSELTDGTVTFQSRATFRYQRCFNESDAAAAPPCVDAMPIDADAIMIPSCGLIADNLMLDGVAPVLRDLEYWVADTGSAPSVGGRVLRDEQSWHQFAVRTRGEDTPATDVAEWLTQTGADSLVGSAQEVMLTTAFLDRTWWREMDAHIGYCSTGVESVAAANIRRQALGSGCPGDYSVDDWDQSDDDGGGGGDNNAWGDPHLTSLDGHAFDFQGGGEFVLTRATRGEPLEIQMRTEPLLGSGPAVCANVSFVTAVATTVGDRRIAVYSLETPRFRIDGVGVTASELAAELPVGAELVLGRARLDIRWPDGTELWADGSGHMSLGITLPPARAGAVEGLLGNFDGNSANDHALPDGEVLPPPVAFDEMHGGYADAWRVTAASSLFDYEPGEDPSTFALVGFPAGPVGLADLPEAERDAARAACLDGGLEHESALSACILDTVCLGDGGASSPIIDARDQPLPVSHQPPGTADVATGGGVELKPVPGTIDDTPWTSPVDRCEKRERRHIALYPEARAVTLAADLTVDAARAGRYDSAASLVNDVVPAGTEVNAWLLHRAGGDASELGLEGFVRFAAPVVGVLVNPTGLDGSDAELGSVATYAAGTARGVELGADWFELSADRRQLRVRLAGTDLDHVRVLTEVAQ